MLTDLPLLGICGFSGAGKTTLIESVVPHLAVQGLTVAIVKHDVHAIQLDRPGKDSDRLFRAGADLLLQGPDETFFRQHTHHNSSLNQRLSALSREYDIVLIEGHKTTPLNKVWLLSEGEETPPEQCEEIVATLARDSDRTHWLLAFISDWLPRQWQKPPLFSALLIGGKSSRMGRPKHLIKKAGQTWLARTVEQLSKVTDQTVIVGEGHCPDELSHMPRLSDIPTVQGPLAGMLAAMRWAPEASWLIVACDLPDLSSDALKWLLAHRAPGIWATLPRLTPRAPVEPLLAHYDCRAHPLLEKLAAENEWSPSKLALHSKVLTPEIPKSLASAWRNVNCPEDVT